MSSSIVNLPAVSIIMTSLPVRLASVIDFSEMLTGVSPSIVNTGTLICSPNVFNWSIAAGR